MCPPGWLLSLASPVALVYDLTNPGKNVNKGTGSLYFFKRRRIKSETSFLLFKSKVQLVYPLLAALPGDAGTGAVLQAERLFQQVPPASGERCGARKPYTACAGAGSDLAVLREAAELPMSLLVTDPGGLALRALFMTPLCCFLPAVVIH